ncbi:hypothetical protein CBR_g39245 [Chara braunii]|uniref:ATP synthase subunit b', chloroplastic n=1 Tax=Chara braunii TaxID=69332 RepID=A0A388LRB5_CHABU|nr:hypothetical protein CBR_g39245 [Chara braunii]|eukprot:GBG84870.1 hypothetical protein CBR_g39245 [Chara braunii]
MSSSSIARLAAAVRSSSAGAAHAEAGARVSLARTNASRLRLNGLAASSCPALRGGERIEVLAELPHVRQVARLVAQARAEGSQPSSSSLHSAVNEAVRAVAGGEETIKRLRPLALVAANALMAFPALAEEKGKIFDFNLTLPIIAVQFLLLMVILDNVWFKPVSKIMDERDESIRSKLESVRDNSGEINKLKEEASAAIREARKETAAALAAMKRETQAELDAKLSETRKRVEKELAEAMEALQQQKDATLQGLQPTVDKLSEEIVSKILPVTVKV